MKLLNRWTRNITVGAALATLANPVIAQDSRGTSGGMKPASYANTVKQSKVAPSSYVHSAENYSLVCLIQQSCGPMGPGGVIAGQPVVLLAIHAMRPAVRLAGPNADVH